MICSTISTEHKAPYLPSTAEVGFDFWSLGLRYSRYFTLYRGFRSKSTCGKVEGLRRGVLRAMAGVVAYVAYFGGLEWGVGLCGVGIEELG